MSTILTAGSILPFVRHKDYEFIRTLGQGACGQSVLLKDDIINMEVVCKKYSPYDESQRESLYKNFVNEIKLLFNLHHINVVRIFNYYLYPKNYTGFILMEYIDGVDISQYLRSNPDEIEQIFIQSVEGFSYLEEMRILHRDIRIDNILVTKKGTLKIIDLGFGKQISTSIDNNKSISLNLWCDAPMEFAAGIYDFTTEIYFVGKLFESILASISVIDFKYSNVLTSMTSRDPKLRTKSFEEVRRAILLGQINEVKFTDSETDVYRAFSKSITKQITQIKEPAKYKHDIINILSEMERIYQKCMLENFIPNCQELLSIFLWGGFKYKPTGFPVSDLKQMLNFFKTVSGEKQKIALANLHARFDAIPRPLPSFVDDDDIPF